MRLCGLVLGDCFDSDSLVELENGEKVSVKNLVKGQNIVCLRSRDGDAIYSSVTDVITTTRYSAWQIIIEPLTEDEEISLIVTQDHYIFSADNADVSPQALKRKTVGNLTINDFLLFKGKLVKIKRISQIDYKSSKTMYSPITSDEVIEVNGIYCHCRSKLTEINNRFLLF